MKLTLKCVVLIFCISFLDAVKFRCDYTYTDLGWLKYHEIPATWENARLRCQLEGGMLASPTTAAMKSIMTSFFKSEIFTGIHAIFSQGDFYSLDGIPLPQIPHKWAPFEPDNKNNNESCLALHSNGTFSDVRCDEPRSYICHRKDSSIDVNVCGTPDPEYYFENITNKCYKFHTKPETWTRASFACSAEGGHLVIINSEEESKIISQMFKKYEAKYNFPWYYHESAAFIGFMNWEKTKDWTTIHGQSLKEAGFAKFGAGQPNNIGGHQFCGSILGTGLLNDAACESYFVFICEKKPEYPTVCDNGISTSVKKSY